MCTCVYVFVHVCQGELSERNSQLVAIKQINDRLECDVNSLKSKNTNLTREVARLMEVDQKLAEANEKIKLAANELATQQLLVSYIVHNRHLNKVKSLTNHIESILCHIYIFVCFLGWYS